MIWRPVSYSMLTGCFCLNTDSSSFFYTHTQQTETLTHTVEFDGEQHYVNWLLNSNLTCRVHIWSPRYGMRAALLLVFFNFTLSVDGECTRVRLRLPLPVAGNKPAVTLTLALLMDSAAVVFLSLTRPTYMYSPVHVLYVLYNFLRTWGHCCPSFLFMLKSAEESSSSSNYFLSLHLFGGCLFNPGQFITEQRTDTENHSHSVSRVHLE